MSASCSAKSGMWAWYTCAQGQAQHDDRHIMARILLAVFIASHLESAPSQHVPTTNSEYSGPEIGQG